MKIYKNLTELIGNTPLVEISKIAAQEKLHARVLVKVESFNPGGSVKDRAALAMIENAEASGLLKPGGTIIEPTSGNTGIGLAWIAALRGYRMILTMPESMSVERRSILKAYGAEVVLTPASAGMKGAIAEAERLEASIPGSIIMHQFENPANPLAHEQHTGVEIYRDTDGEVDMVVAGVGTGGTISGIARTLKKLKPSVKAVAVEPAESAVLEGKAPHPHGIQGIGAGFIPENYDSSVIDEVKAVSLEEALSAEKLLAQTEGIFAGISSGAALYAAIEIARHKSNKGKTIVVILPDTGERYLSNSFVSKN